jgi:hypothetical protein
MRQRQGNLLSNSGGMQIHANVPQGSLQFGHAPRAFGIRIRASERTARTTRFEPGHGSSQEAIAELEVSSFADSQ